MCLLGLVGRCRSNTTVLYSNRNPVHRLNGLYRKAFTSAFNQRRAMTYSGMRTDLSPGCSPLASLSSVDMDSVVKECKWRLDEIPVPQKLERAALVKPQFCTYVCSLPPSHFFSFPAWEKKPDWSLCAVLMSNPIIREIPNVYFWLSRLLPTAHS